MHPGIATKTINGPIAIDGPAASGKSTIAKLLAERLGGFYVSTGDMYRAISWECVKRGIDPTRRPEQVAAMLEDLKLECIPGEDGLPHIVVNGTEIRPEQLHSPEVAGIVSPVAAIPEVRAWLIDCQRNTVSLGLVILEGRDIGTVIFPNAPHKFFLTATPEERARRRLLQGGDVAEGATVESVAAKIAERDRIDSSRKVAPLRQAEDAVLVDTTNMTVAEVLESMQKTIIGDHDNATRPQSPA